MHYPKSRNRGRHANALPRSPRGAIAGPAQEACRLAHIGQTAMLAVRRRHDAERPTSAASSMCHPIATASYVSQPVARCPDAPRSQPLSPPTARFASRPTEAPVQVPGTYCTHPTAPSFGDRSIHMATTMLVSRSPESDAAGTFYAVHAASSSCSTRSPRPRKPFVFPGIQ